MPPGSVSICLAIAIAVGMGAFVIADGLKQRHGSGCDHSGVCAVIAGVFWPVLVVGLLRFLTFAASVQLASVLSRGASNSGVPTATAR